MVLNTGLNISSSTPESLTLEMLGLTDERVQELYWLLNTKFKLDLPKQCLPQLSIAKLKKLHYKNVDIILQKKSSGFQGYLTNSMFDQEELDATADTIHIPTLLHRSKQRGDEYNTCETYLCIVPGMEGHRNRFKALCERLKLPAVMLFPEVNRPDETLREVAQRLVNVMKRKLKDKNNFYLLGYESGVLLALEMSHILEGYGKTGTVYCVGGTPEDIHSSLTSHLGDLGSERLQDSLLEHIYQLIVGNKSDTMGADLLKARTWDDKLNTCLKALHGKMNNSYQYMRTVIESAYFRIQLLNKNHRNKFGPFRSKIVVLKAVPRVCSDSQTESKLLLSDEPLVLHDLGTTLPYATEDMRCSAIINKNLGQDYLDDFNSRNQCETYLLDNTLYNSAANSDNM